MIGIEAWKVVAGRSPPGWIASCSKTKVVAEDWSYFFFLCGTLTNLKFERLEPDVCPKGGARAEASTHPSPSLSSELREVFMDWNSCVPLWLFRGLIRCLDIPYEGMVHLIISRNNICKVIPTIEHHWCIKRWWLTWKNERRLCTSRCKMKPSSCSFKKIPIFAKIGVSVANK